MKILVLAAGRSKRMKPVEDKNFLNFLGQPLIKWQLDMLWENGFKDVVLVGGAHNLDRLRELDNDMPMKIDVVLQENLDEGMKGAVLAAEDLIKDDEVMIFSSNDVVSSEAFKIMKEAAEADLDADGFLLAKKVTEYFPGGYLSLDDDDFINGVIEKPEPGSEPSDLINLVVHYFRDTKILIKNLKKAESKKDDLYEKALDTMILEGAKLRAVGYDGYWQAIKYPWHVGPVFEYFLDLRLGGKERDISGGADVSDNAVVDGKVIIGDGARVMDGATVKGPCYIGRKTIVATNALVRGSNLGESCVIGFSTEVARSYLGDNVWTHSNYIGDSVIGNDVSFGAGAVTGNLRLDEGMIGETGTNKWGLVTGDHVRVGVNTSFMPGVRVGGESFVGAGIVVAEDIPEKSFVRGKWDLKISENKGEFSEEMREMMRKKL
ncbi:NTP transferase domain-containing protein [Candidatus Peregrinibacteria bacterium]|nr:NTP transferase domain-containing protein [Candidatus Peregrinibacteria bacterium]MBT4148638.1 NTP transferase domain-containing protein [Candidatus Peregrinibacteria bacterium]MBT4366227.1 NTP transferase domain-containing protein [Candidatus Peregrinibacteria bacterium]MBT4456031.1 NTP transferase domain-containing protein [Candidatus Peregrinibacteria bacterium]